MKMKGDRGEKIKKLAENVNVTAIRLLKSFNLIVIDWVSHIVA